MRPPTRAASCFARSTPTTGLPPPGSRRGRRCSTVTARVTFVSHWLETFGDEHWTWKPERCDLPALLARNTINGAALVTTCGIRGRRRLRRIHAPRMRRLGLLAAPRRGRLSGHHHSRGALLLPPACRVDEPRDDHGGRVSGSRCETLLDKHARPYRDHLATRHRQQGSRASGARTTKSPRSNATV